MNRIKILLLIPPIVIFCSCTEKHEPVQKTSTSAAARTDIRNNEDKFVSTELKLLKKITQNSSNPEDSLYYLAEKAGGISIEPLGKEAWIINLWYGGSYEDIFVYTKNKTGFYNKILALSGAISFSVQTKTDHGLKRFKVKNNRNSKYAVFQYDGTDYSNFAENGIRKHLTDSSGVNTLQRIEIYNHLISK